MEAPASVLNEMSSASQAGATYYRDSGDLFKWIGVLRAADSYWNPDHVPVLFLLDTEKLEGDSPRIVVRPRRG